MNNLIKIFLFILPLTIIYKLPAQSAKFGAAINMGLIENDLINEASGLAASRKNAKVLWTHNDSGGKNRLFALDVHGRHLGIYQVGSYKARDWEDMTIGPGPIDHKDYIYIGDIGDNGANHNLNYIYRILEPTVYSNQSPKDSLITNENIDTIVFLYPDGARNAEALMIDPVNNDLYVISKNETEAKVYLARYPQPISKIFTLQHVATLHIPYVVAADVSVSGEEILIKTYSNIFYWQRNISDTLWQILSTTPDTLPYTIEPQGESICWASDNSGYFTISEEPVNIPAYLYFYPRLDNASIKMRRGRSGSFYLKQNYPNPFNQSTTISYCVANSGTVQLLIYDELGRVINNLNSKIYNTGSHSETWDGKDTNGNFVPSGIYFYRLTTEKNISQSRSMVLLK